MTILDSIYDEGYRTGYQKCEVEKVDELQAFVEQLTDRRCASCGRWVKDRGWGKCPGGDGMLFMGSIRTSPAFGCVHWYAKTERHPQCSCDIFVEEFCPVHHPGTGNR